MLTDANQVLIQGWLLALAPYFMAVITAWLTLGNRNEIKQTKVAVQEGTAVSIGNKTALVAVQDKQDTNRTAIIEGVKHELKNGAGDAIATKLAAHITPAIEDIKKTIPVEVAKTAEVVAAALAEAKLIPYEGDDQRGSLPGRRETDQK